MFQKILVAMALDHGVSQHTLQIANKLKNDAGEILALHVIEEPHGSANVRLREDMLTTGEERERDLFQEKLADHPDVHLMLARGHVSRTILDVAREEGYQRPLPMILEAQGVVEPRISRAIRCSWA